MRRGGPHRRFCNVCPRSILEAPGEMAALGGEDGANRGTAHPTLPGGPGHPARLSWLRWVGAPVMERPARHPRRGGCELLRTKKLSPSEGPRRFLSRACRGLGHKVAFVNRFLCHPPLGAGVTPVPLGRGLRLPPPLPPTSLSSKWLHVTGFLGTAVPGSERGLYVFFFLQLST